MALAKNYPESRGFIKQEDGSYRKVHPATHENMVWDEKKQVGVIVPPDAKTTDEEKLNKTEKARLAYLRMLGVRCLNIQAITLKIADDCRFTADFTYVDENGRLAFEDTKGGFIREDSFIKIKVCARKYPEFRFGVVTKLKGGGWDVREIKP